MYAVHTLTYNPDWKRKGILTQAAARVNLEDIVLSELSQPQKDKYWMIPLR